MKIKLLYTPVTSTFLKIDPAIVHFPSGFFLLDHFVDESLVDDFILLFKKRKLSLTNIRKEFKSYKAISEYNNKCKL